MKNKRKGSMTFSHTLETSASPETIWSIWAAVGWWPEWDRELKHAQLEREFQPGAVGQLTPKTGPPSTFVIVQNVIVQNVMVQNVMVQNVIIQIESGKSYTFTTQLLLCELVIHRCLQVGRDGSAPLSFTHSFTHKVSFVGPLACLFNLLLGNRFRQALPKAMQQIKQLAESQNLQCTKNL